jgi:hypothetical protein
MSRSANKALKNYAYCGVEKGFELKFSNPQEF